MVKTTTVSHEQIHCRMFSRCFVFANVQEFHIRQRMLPTTPVNNFPWHTNPHSGPRVLSHSSNANVFATSACLLPSQHTHTQHTHQHHPHHPQHRTHTVRQTQTHRDNQNTNRQTDGWTQTDTTFSDTPTLHRHTTHTSPQHTQYNNTHNTTTRQHDYVLTDKETETETETDRQTDQTRSDQIRSDQIRQTEHNRTERKMYASVCVWCVRCRVV